MTAGHHCAHVQRGADRRAAACDEAPPSAPTGLSRPRGQADQRGDLLSVEASKLGQLHDQGSCDGRSNTRNGGQEGLLPEPCKRPVYRTINRAVDHTLLLLQRLYDAPDAVSNARWSLARLLPLGRDQSYDLTASRDEISQGLGLGIGPSANGWAGGRREPGDDSGVDPVGFGTLAQGVSEGTDLCWVHDHSWQPPGGESTCHHGFPNRRLPHDGTPRRGGRVH